MNGKIYSERYGSCIVDKVIHDCMICEKKMNHCYQNISMHLKTHNTTMASYYERYILKNKRKLEPDEGQDEPCSKKLKIKLKTKHFDDKQIEKEAQKKSSTVEMQQKPDSFQNITDKNNASKPPDGFLFPSITNVVSLKEPTNGNSIQLKTEELHLSARPRKRHS